MNVSKEADTEFMRSLESEDQRRHAALMKNIRRDNPTVAMTESQALTNFMLGLPTAGFKFAVVAGSPVSTATVNVDVSKRQAVRNLKKRIRQARAMKSRFSATYPISTPTPPISFVESVG